MENLVKHDESETRQLPYVKVDYEEWNPETYRGIVIDHEGVQTRVNTGDFQRDYEHVVAEYAPFWKSGTVDNYITDMNAKKAEG